MGLCWSEPHVESQTQFEPVAVQLQSTVPPQLESYPIQQPHGLPPHALHITVKTFTGGLYQFPILLQQTVYQIKQRICAISGIPAERQILLYRGIKLEDSKYVYYYSIPSGAILYVVVRMDY